MPAAAQPSSTAARVLRRIQRWPRGRVFVPRDLLGPGVARGALDVALHRLIAKGHIRRLGRGLYDRPVIHPRLGPLTPAPDELAQAVARARNQVLALSDASAANRLGLTTQVPGRPVYLTDGPTRSVRVGHSTLRFQHAAPARLRGGDTVPGLVLRALRFLGRDGIDHAALERLRSSLSAGDRAALADLRNDAPGWMQPILDSLSAPDAEPVEAA